MNADRRRELTRREALAAGLATAGALALGRAGLAADSANDSDYGPFKMGIQSYSLREFKYHEALNKTKALGLHYWEAWNGHLPAVASKADESRELAERHGVKIRGYGVIGMGKDHDANRKTFEFGKALGLDYFSIAPTAGAFDSLDKLVEEYGIAVGIHNHGPGDHFAKIDTIFDAIKGHSEKIGACIDTGHFLRSKEDPVRAAEVFGKRIYGVHLKDVKDATKFTVLGEGDLRLAEFLKVLAKLNYKDNVAIEYEENPKDPMADIKASLGAVKKAVAQI